VVTASKLVSVTHPAAGIELPVIGSAIQLPALPLAVSAATLLASLGLLATLLTTLPLLAVLALLLPALLPLLTVLALLSLALLTRLQRLALTPLPLSLLAGASAQLLHLAP